MIKKFTPAGAGSFAADMAMSDVDGDGSVDYAYAADTKGNIYRIDFSARHTPRWPGLLGHAEGGLHQERAQVPVPAFAAARGHQDVCRRWFGQSGAPAAHQLPVHQPVKNRFYVLLDDLTMLPRLRHAATNMDSDGMKNYTQPRLLL